MRKEIPFLEADLAAIPNLNEFHARDLAKEQKLADQFDKHHPSKLILIVGDESGYYDHSEIIIDHPTLVIRVSKISGKKPMYYLYSPTNDRLADKLSQTDRIKATGFLVQPNRFSKPNAKSIADWIKYLEDFNKAVTPVVNAQLNEAEAFLKSIEDLPIQWRAQNNPQVKVGSVVMNGIEYSFRVDAAGYISQKIELHYSVSATAENFRKLAANQFEMQDRFKKTM